VFGTDQLVEVSRQLAQVDVAGLSNDELRDLVVQRATAQRMQDAFDSHMLAELDARGACDTDLGLKTGPWLARETKVRPGVAKARVTVANQLRRHLPLVAAALAAGEISFDHAQALAAAANPRVVDQIAAVQEALIAATRLATFEAWQRHLRSLVELLDQDGAHDPDRELARNTLTITKTTDGETHFKGLFTGDFAAVFAHAVEQKADEIFRRLTRDAERCPGELVVPPRATLQAMALIELVGDGLRTDPTKHEPPRTEMIVTIRGDDPDNIRDTDGVRAPDGFRRMLRCNADLYAIIMSSLGVPLDLGRRVRHATPAQRRAIHARDGRCTFPGCDHPARWCDVHHVEHWEHGGNTNVNQMLLICRHHHRVTHRPGWQLLLHDGWPYWITPNGHTFWGQRHSRQREGPPPEPVRAGDTPDHPDHPDHPDPPGGRCDQPH